TSETYERDDAKRDKRDGSDRVGVFLKPLTLHLITGNETIRRSTSTAAHPFAARRRNDLCWPRHDPDAIADAGSRSSRPGQVGPRHAARAGWSGSDVRALRRWP